jgi:aryl-alcohol dehydrogenase-like predicted oxidoreductase
LRVSLAGLGCNNFGLRCDLEQSRAVIDKAIDLGVTLFDTADSYGDAGGGSERILGKVLGARRKDVVLATKFGFSPQNIRVAMGASRSHITTACEDSLRRLKTDWIDLYQIHAPDPLTPIDETLRAMDDLIHQGKVRYIGCSNFAAWQLVEAQWTSRDLGLNPLASCQAEYSLLNRDIEQELTPAMTAYGAGLLPYFPLASGLLTGKYARGVTPGADTRLGAWSHMGGRFLNERNFALIARLEDFAACCSRSLLELAFAWLASQACVSSIIAGATKPEHVEANARALDWRLSEADLARLADVLAAEA